MTDVRPEQRSNAQPPIEVTLLGIVIEFRLEHSTKALSPIEVTLKVLLLYTTYSGIKTFPEYSFLKA